MNYIDLLLIVTAAITECVSISPFAFIVVISIGITSFSIGLKICIITPAIKKYKSIVKEKKKND